MTALTVDDLPYRDRFDAPGREASSTWGDSGCTREKFAARVLFRLDKLLAVHPEHETALRGMLADHTAIPYEATNTGRYMIEGEYRLPNLMEGAAAGVKPWDGFTFLTFTCQQLGFHLWPLGDWTTDEQLFALPGGSAVRWALDRVQTDEQRRVMVDLMTANRCDVNVIREVGNTVPVVGAVGTRPGGRKGEAYEAARVFLIGGPKPRSAVKEAIAQATGGGRSEQNAAATYIVRLVREGMLVSYPPGYLSLPGMKRVIPVAAAELDDSEEL